MRRPIEAFFCAGLLGLAACPPEDTPRDGGTDGGGGPSTWQVVFEGHALTRSLLSVWGSSEADVFAVGGPLGNAGLSSLVLHFDGTTWRDLGVSGTETFWWVAGTGPDDVWFVGEQGRMVHWDGAHATDLPRLTTATLYGVWPAAKNDAWAVGGTVEGGTAKPNDVVLHWDGTAWSPSPLPGAPLGRTLFKIWGSGPDDIYAVGEFGTIWHRALGTWTLATNLPKLGGNLLTVHGSGPSEVYAVGGRDVLHWDGAAWSAVPLDLEQNVAGVTFAAPGVGLLVGDAGLKKRLVAGVWVDDFADDPHGTLHGSWGDPATGTFWTAGGDYVSAPSPNRPREGILARYGKGSISTTLAP
jgi:hypothetical protein